MTSSARAIKVLIESSTEFAAETGAQPGWRGFSFTSFCELGNMWVRMFEGERALLLLRQRDERSLSLTDI